MKNTQKLINKITAGVIVFSLGVMNVSAAALSGMSDTLSSAKINTVSNHTIKFTTPTGIAAGSTTIITFQSNFSIPAALDYTDVDINIGGAYVGSSTLGATPSGATIGVATTSATVITITNGNVAVPPGSVVYIRIGTNAIHDATGVRQITNATTFGNKTVNLAGTMSDNGTTTVDLLTNDTVQVNAVVPQSITFSISSNSISFGNLTSGAVRYASTSPTGDTASTSAHNLEIGTNAPSGYTITVQGQTLTSQQNASNTITALVSPAASLPGSEQFGIYATKSGGTNGTISATYSTLSQFGYNATATTSATFASGTSSTNTETFLLYYIANIAALTEAGTYSANLVYVGTSNF